MSMPRANKSVETLAKKKISFGCKVSGLGLLALGSGVFSFESYGFRVHSLGFKECGLRHSAQDL